jgi:uridine phosphorylase
MDKNKFLPLLKVNIEAIKEKVLVCGDPARAARIAKYMDSAEEISYNREYRLFKGIKNGVEISIASHGVGAPGAAICFEELIKGGAKEIIRVGTAGSLNPSINDGDIVLARAAIREDGLSEQLISPAYPAVASCKLLERLERLAFAQGVSVHKGIILTIAAFYPELLDLPNNKYSKAGAIAVEMETSALFIISSLHGIDAGSVLAIDGIAIDFDAEAYNPHRDLVNKAIDISINLAINALLE